MENLYSSQCEFPLPDLPTGTDVQILRLESAGLSRRRMLDLGLIPGTQINIVRKSPLGDPIVYKIRGAFIALRKEESANIFVRPIVN